MSAPPTVPDHVAPAPLPDLPPPAVALTHSYRVDDLLINAPEGLIKPIHLTVLANGGYEAAEIALATAMIKPGRRVLEFGGGIGVVSRHIAQITGPGSVLSVEANPKALATARDHLGRDGLGVTHRWGMVVGAGSGGADGRLLVDPQNFLASHPGPSNPDDPQGWQVDCPALALSDLISAWRPQALVVDIEGAERDLFTGADLSGIEALILEFHPAEIGVEGCLGVMDCLRDHGLLPDPGLIAGAVLGFVREPAGPDLGQAAFRRLFQALAQPGAELSPMARAFPASPLLTLRALTKLAPNTPDRTDALTTLARNPMTARTATRLLAQDALARGDNDRALDLMGPSTLGQEAQIAAVALLRLKRIPEALEAARRAVTALPHSAQALLLFARLCLASGDSLAARSAATGARDLHPTTPGLDQFLQTLAALPK